MVENKTSGEGGQSNPMPVLPYGQVAVNRRFSWTFWIVLATAVAFVLLLVDVLPQPSRANMRERANRVKCGFNLRQIAQGLMLYANDNGGQFPSDLSLLVSAADLPAELYICPSGPDTKATGPTTQAITAQLKQPGFNSYIYVGPAAAATKSPTVVVAYEPLTNHGGEGMNILWADGHVSWETAANAAVILKNVPTNPAAGAGE